MPASPPIIFAPPAAGAAPTAPGIVFVPPAAGAAPTAPVIVFAPPAAGAAPTAPGIIFAPPAAGAAPTAPGIVFVPPAAGAAPAAPGVVFTPPSAGSATMTITGNVLYNGVLPLIGQFEGSPAYSDNPASLADPQNPPRGSKIIYRSGGGRWVVNAVSSGNPSSSSSAIETVLVGGTVASPELVASWSATLTVTLSGSGGLAPPVAVFGT